MTVWSKRNTQSLGSWTSLASRRELTGSFAPSRKRLAAHLSLHVSTERHSSGAYIDTTNSRDIINHIQHIRARGSHLDWFSQRTTLFDLPSASMLDALSRPHSTGFGTLQTWVYRNPLHVHYYGTYKLHMQSRNIPAYYFQDEPVNDTLAARFFLLFSDVQHALMDSLHIPFAAIHSRDWTVAEVLQPYLTALKTSEVHRTLRLDTPLRGTVQCFTWPHGPSSSPVLGTSTVPSDYLNYLLVLPPTATSLFSIRSYPRDYRNTDQPPTWAPDETPCRVNSSTALNNVMQYRNILSAAVEHILSHQPNHPTAGDNPRHDPHPAFCTALLISAAALVTTWVHLHPPRVPCTVPTRYIRSSPTGHDLDGRRENLLTTHHLTPTDDHNLLASSSRWRQVIQPQTKRYLTDMAASYPVNRENSRFASLVVRAVHNHTVLMFNPLSETDTPTQNMASYREHVAAGDGQGPPTHPTESILWNKSGQTAPIDLMMDILRFFPHLRRHTPFSMSSIRFSHPNWSAFYVTLLMHMVTHAHSMESYSYETNSDNTLYLGDVNLLHRCIQDLPAQDNFSSVLTWGKEQGLPIRVTLTPRSMGEVLDPRSLEHSGASLHLSHPLVTPSDPIRPLTDASVCILPSIQGTYSLYSNPYPYLDSCYTSTRHYQPIQGFGLPLDAYAVVQGRQPEPCARPLTRPTTAYSPLLFPLQDTEELQCHQTRCINWYDTSAPSLHSTSIFLIRRPPIYNSEDDFDTPSPTSSTPAGDNYEEPQDFFTTQLDDVYWRPGQEFPEGQAAVYQASTCAFPVHLDPPTPASLLPGRLQGGLTSCLSHMDPNYLQEGGINNSMPDGAVTPNADRGALHPDCDLFIGHHRDGTEAQRKEMAAMLNRMTPAVARTMEDLREGYKGIVPPMHIEKDNDKQAFTSPYRKPPIEKLAQDKVCAELLLLGFIEPAPSAQHAANPVVALKKGPDGHGLGDLSTQQPWTPLGIGGHARRNISTPGKVLRRFDINARTLIHCDWSQHGLGAVLGQLDSEGNEYLVACASRSLNKHEAGYSRFKGEMLAACWACKIFRVYVFGLHFTLVTDHQPLLWMFSSANVTGAIARWACMLQSFDFDIMHRPGAQHGNADALSRFPSPTAEDNTGARIDLDSDLYAAFPTVPTTPYVPLDLTLGHIVDYVLDVRSVLSICTTPLPAAVTYMAQNGITLYEMCGGMCAGLEAALRNGIQVNSPPLAPGRQLDTNLRLAAMSKDTDGLDIHSDQFVLEYLRRDVLGSKRTNICTRRGMAKDIDIAKVVTSVQLCPQDDYYVRPLHSAVRPGSRL
eukprot:gene25886-biopygen20380